MRTSQLSLKRSLLLSTVFTLTVFTAGALAADDTTTASDTATTATEAAATQSTTSETGNMESAITAGATTSSADTTTSADSAMPALSTSTTAANSDMPTLSSTSSLDTSIPTYPAATVPPTSNAPYMQTSNMPDGTVFIAVGAILGAFGLALLLWRAIIACLLHRSVEKAAMAQHIANDKAAFPTAPPPFAKYTDQDSSQKVGSGRGVRRSTRGPIPSATPSQTNLFFSPTAAGGAAASRDSVYRDAPNRDSSYRDSRFLPAGFYAAGSSSPQNMDGAEGSAISLNNLRPDARGPGRRLSGHSPPESPNLRASRSPLVHDASTSSVNLNSAPNGRAPSAYLDDLLTDQPELFPPSGASQHPYRQSGRF